MRFRQHVILRPAIVKDDKKLRNSLLDGAVAESHSSYCREIPLRRGMQVQVRQSYAHTNIIRQHLTISGSPPGCDDADSILCELSIYILTDWGCRDKREKATKTKSHGREMTAL